MNARRFATAYVPSADQERTEWMGKGAVRPDPVRTVRATMNKPAKGSLVRFAFVALALAIVAGAVAGIAL